MAFSFVSQSDDVVVAKALEAFGIRSTRIDILRSVLSRGETSAADLMSEFGLSRNGALSHLRSLTAAGLLHERHDTHPRGSGPITYWGAHEDDVSLVLETLIDYVLRAT